MLEPLFLQLSLQQLVTSATHFHPSCHRQDSLLDLVLSSIPAMVSSTSVLPPLGNSDHGVVRCLADLSLCSHHVKSRLTRIWAYDKADMTKLNKTLRSADWSPVTTAPSIDDAWIAWKRIFLEIVNQHLPSKVVSQVKRKQPWITKNLEKVICEKH